MNNKLRNLFVFLVFPALALQPHAAQAQGTGFTYQGVLTSSNGLANGSYSLSFTLFATNTGGAAVAGPVTNSSVTVSNGLFTTVVDFGAGVFTGSSNWVEIAVATNGSTNFGTLSPRQQLTPVPNAIFAENAGIATLTSNLSGTLPVSQLPSVAITNTESGVSLCGTFCGTGTGLTTVTTVAFLYAYSLAAQPSGGPGAWITATFGLFGPTDTSAVGWTYIPGTATFVCNSPGLYLIEYNAEVAPAVGGAGSMSLRAFTTIPPGPGAFIPASQASLATGAFPVGTFIPVSKSFLAPFAVGQTLNIQFASTLPGGVALVTPVGVAAGAQPSVSCTFVKIF